VFNDLIEVNLGNFITFVQPLSMFNKIIPTKNDYGGYLSTESLLE